MAAILKLVWFCYKGVGVGLTEMIRLIISKANCPRETANCIWAFPPLVEAAVGLGDLSR